MNEPQVIKQGGFYETRGHWWVSWTVEQHPEKGWVGTINLVNFVKDIEEQIYTTQHSHKWDFDRLVVLTEHLASAKKIRNAHEKSGHLRLLN